MRLATSRRAQRLRCICTADSETTNSLTWHSRGWTYQEFMLSKRMLFFTPQLVFYICAQRSFAEDHYRPPAGTTYTTKSKAKPANLTKAELVAEIDQRHTINMRREFRYAQNFHAYRNLVEDLSIRHLTYQGDALKSMAGVLQAMILSGAEIYICGLPSSMLEWGLLWQPKGPLTRRGSTSTGPLFPSWSWIGWEGPKKYIDHPGPEGLEILVKNWQFLTDESQDYTRPKPASLSKLFRKQTLSSKKSSDSSPTNAGLRSLLPYQPIVACIDPIWTPTTWLSWKSAPEPKDRLRRHQSAMNARGTLIERGILHFSTSTSSFYIIASPLPDGYEGFPQSLTGSFRILDIQGTWVGTVHLPLEFARTLPPRYTAEFIALSKTHVSNEETNTISVGQNTFDTTALRELDQKARVGTFLLLFAPFVTSLSIVSGRLESTWGVIFLPKWSSRANVIAYQELGTRSSDGTSQLTTYSRLDMLTTKLLTGESIG